MILNSPIVLLYLAVGLTISGYYRSGRFASLYNITLPFVLVQLRSDGYSSMGSCASHEGFATCHVG